MSDTMKTYFARIRAEEQRALLARVAAAYEKVPELAALDRSRRAVFSDTAARRITPAEGVACLDAIRRDELSALRAAGLPDDELELHYRCTLCRDTGYTGDGRRTPCACYLRAREAQKGESGINARETFEHFDENIYRDAAQKKRALNAARLCREYAAALPRPEKPNLLLMGMPGLGKSFLGNAIGRAALDCSVDAARVTAYRFVQDILLDIRENRKNAVRYQTVPLLILDDLGSEPEIPNVSTEWLFAVINERVLAGRASVCITNLSLSELQARYGERLMSRLCDKNTTLVMQLTGLNLRL